MNVFLAFVFSLVLTASAHAAYVPFEALGDVFVPAQWANSSATLARWAEFAQLKETTGKSWVELTTNVGVQWGGSPPPYLSMEQVTEFYETGTQDAPSNYFVHAYEVPPSISTIGRGYGEIRFPYHLADGTLTPLELFSRTALVATPLPPAVLLFGAGLLVLGAMRARTYWAT